MSDIERRRGDTYPVELTVTDKQTGSPVDVTGGTFLMTVDPAVDPTNSDNNIFQSTGTIVDAQNGVVEFPISALAADHVGVYYYDMQMTLNTYVSTVCAGKYTLVQDITK